MIGSPFQFRSIVPNIDVDDVCGTSRILSGLHSVASATKKPLKKGSKVRWTDNTKKKVTFVFQD